MRSIRTGLFPLSECFAPKIRPFCSSPFTCRRRRPHLPTFRFYTITSLSPDSEKPRSFPNTGFEVIGPDYLVEEEAIPGYKAEKYYPARLGEIIGGSYQLLGKLGYGTGSTVWFCRDLTAHQYATVKITVRSPREQREISIYNHLKQVTSDHVGRSYIRELVDSFEISGPNGQHVCLVHPPLGRSLMDLKEAARNEVLTEDVLKPCLRRVLIALDYLHKEARIVHTDIQPNNLLLEIDDTSVLPAYEKDQIERPVARKLLADRTIYTSRSIRRAPGLPILSDFGEARFGDEEHYEDIMPNVYRAPEVILGIKWSYTVDIWSVAMMAWDLFEPDRIFRGRNPDGKYDDGYHLAEMVAIMGPPPLEFLERTENSLRFWDEKGNWRGLVPIPDITLEMLERRLDGEHQAQFLHFIRSMLRWIPEERPTAEECVFNDWLMEGLFGPDGLPVN